MVDGVTQGLAEIAGGEVGLEMIDDEAMNLVCDGAAATAANEGAASGWGGSKTGLFFDKVNLLEGEECP